MIDRLSTILDRVELVKRIDGITQHSALSWLFNISNPEAAIRCINQVLDIEFQVGVEIGCGCEPTRSYLLKPGLWFAFDPNCTQSYFDNAGFDWTPEELASLVSIPYQLILVPTEFHAQLIPKDKIHTFLFRNPNHLGYGGPQAFDQVPDQGELKSGQRVVIVRDDSINGPYEQLLRSRGYLVPQFTVWNNPAFLTSDKPKNREFRAEVFDFTKST